MWSLSSFISKGLKISESGSNRSKHWDVLDSCNACQNFKSVSMWLDGNTSLLHNLQYQRELFLANVNSSRDNYIYLFHGLQRKYFGENHSCEMRYCYMSISGMSMCYVQLFYNLTYWDRNKMAAIIQMTFQIHFLQWKCMNFDYNFTKVFSWGSNLQHFSICTDNGLAPARQQAIVWTNDGQFTEAYMCHSAAVN